MNKSAIIGIVVGVIALAVVGGIIGCVSCKNQPSPQAPGGGFLAASHHESNIGVGAQHGTGLLIHPGAKLHASAIVGNGVCLDEGAEVHATGKVGSEVELHKNVHVHGTVGDRVRILAGAVIEYGATVPSDSEVPANARVNAQYNSYRFPAGPHAVPAPASPTSTNQPSPQAPGGGFLAASHHESNIGVGAQHGTGLLIHPGAKLHASAIVGNGVCLDEGAEVHATGKVGNNVHLHKGVQVYATGKVGSEVELHENVHVHGTVGDRVRILAGAVIEHGATVPSDTEVPANSRVNAQYNSYGIGAGAHAVPTPASPTPIIPAAYAVPAPAYHPTTPHSGTRTEPAFKGAGAQVFPGARFGEGVSVLAGARVHATARIGNLTSVGSNAIVHGTVGSGTSIGARCIIDAGVTIGNDRSVPEGVRVTVQDNHQYM